MKIDYLPRALAILDDAPAEVRKAFFKQIKLLEQNLRHPSLKAKKYDESQDLWQARVNKAWRFYVAACDGTENAHIPGAAVRGHPHDFFPPPVA